MRQLTKQQRAEAQRAYRAKMKASPEHAHLNAYISAQAYQNLKAISRARGVSMVRALNDLLVGGSYG